MELTWTQPGPDLYLTWTDLDPSLTIWTFDFELSAKGTQPTHRPTLNVLKCKFILHMWDLLLICQA